MMTAAGQTFTPERIQRFIRRVARRALCLTGLVIVVALCVSLRTDHRPARINAINRLTAPAVPEEEHKIYPFSVIYGGAYSAVELNRARRIDPIVKAHYADFGVSPAVQKTPSDLFMYVSYRKSDKIYWTATKRRIPQGEALLSDGKNWARARCGNRLSFVPQQPLNPKKDVAEAAFDFPEAPKASLPSDMPEMPTAEAALYIPENALLSSLVPPPLAPFAAAGPLSAAAGSAGVGPAPIGAPGVMLGAGTPFVGGGAFIPTGSGLPVQSARANGVPATGGENELAAFAATPVSVDIPEPTTIKLFLISLLAIALLSFRRKRYPKL